jgi:hypothetical protein
MLKSKLRPEITNKFQSHCHNKVYRSPDGDWYILEIKNKKGIKIIKFSGEDLTLVNSVMWGMSTGNRVKQSKRSSLMTLHRAIMDWPNRPFVVDHINGDSLDNRRDNLRVCTSSQNSMNRKNYSGKYKGVTIKTSKYTGRITYEVRVLVNKKVVFYKTMYSLREAVLMYNENAIKFHGEFARVNQDIPC